MSTEKKDQKVVTEEVVDSPQQEETKEVALPLIEKAGIVAFNRSGNFIVITTTKADSDKWVLPKGHLEEKDSSLLECAVRELKEETGYIVEPYTPSPVAVVQRIVEDPNAGYEGEYAVEEISFFIGEIRGIEGDPERSVMLVEPHLAIRKLAYEDYAKVVVKAVTTRAAFIQAKVAYMTALARNGQKEGTVN